MRTIDCPNCGNTIADPTAGCSCGFSLFDGVEVPPPAIVRETAQHSLRDDEDDDARQVGAGSGSDRMTATGTTDDTEEIWPFDEVLASVDEQLTAAGAGTFPTRAPSPSQPAPASRSGAAPPARRPAPVPPSPASATPAATATPRITAPPASAPSTRSTGAPAHGKPREGMLMGCPSCAARISRRAPACPKCGKAPFAHCQICTSRILSNSASCPECGDPSPFHA